MDSVITNVNVGLNKDLSKVRRVGKHFLVTGHSGIETNFACGSAYFTNGGTFKNGSVGENQGCGEFYLLVQGCLDFGKDIYSD